jgi:glycosyltransferase involved in cell wall biosynthesis
VLGSFGIGGGERVALDLAVGQRDAGADVAVVSLEEPADGPLAADYEAQRIEIVRVPKKSGGVDPLLVAKLARVFRRWRADVVHTHNPPPLIYAAPAAKLAGARCVHTKHGANAMPSRRRVLSRVAGRFVDAFVCVSEMTAATARGQREIADEKIVTIENGIDLSRFVRDAAEHARVRGEVRAELGIAPDAFVVGSVGRIVAEKNQALLVDALAPELSPSMALVIAGDGPLLPALREKVSALGEKSPRVHLLGARRDVPRLYAAFDVFALSSDSEGLPLVIVEAMAAGLPVVSTDVGGIAAVVIDGETGLLAPRGDGHALVAKIAALAAQPTLAVRLGEEGRRRALARYSRQRMVDDYFAVYDRARRRR